MPCSRFYSLLSVCCKAYSTGTQQINVIFNLVLKFCSSLVITLLESRYFTITSGLGMKESNTVDCVRCWDSLFINLIRNLNIKLTDMVSYEGLSALYYVRSYVCLSSFYLVSVPKQCKNKLISHMFQSYRCHLKADILKHIVCLLICFKYQPKDDP